MSTVTQILHRAAKSIRYIGRNETLSAQDATDALACFNAMLDSWSNENLMSYVVLENSFTLSVNKASYTVGSGGDVNVTRPLDITQAYVQDTGGNNYLLRIKNRDWWNQIGNRSSTITSQIPTDLFYDPQYPLGVINIFPVPLIAYTVYFDSTQDQVEYTSLTTSLSLPVGYEEAYVKNLGLHMISEGFPSLLNAEEMAVLVDAARTGKANVKRTNIKTSPANYDAAIVSRSYATYNIYRDSSN